MKAVEQMQKQLLRYYTKHNLQVIYKLKRRQATNVRAWIQKGLSPSKAFDLKDTPAEKAAQ